jgi:hypothetical protein
MVFPSPCHLPVRFSGRPNELSRCNWCLPAPANFGLVQASILSASACAAASPSRCWSASSSTALPIGLEETGPKLPDHCQRSIAGHESVESDVSQLICARKRGENCWPRVGNISSLPSSGRFHPSDPSAYSQGKLELTPKQRAILEKWARARSFPARVVGRARKRVTSCGGRGKQGQKPNSRRTCDADSYRARGDWPEAT